MSLIDVMKSDVVMMDKHTVPDGMGGVVRQWTEGAPFKAAIVKDSSLAARVAEKEGVSEIYTVTVSDGVLLEYHDVFKRIEDGAIFRVTSNSYDSRPPSIASFQFMQVTAERWVLS